MAISRLIESQKVTPKMNNNAIYNLQTFQHNANKVTTNDKKI